MFRERGDYKRGCIKKSCCLERGELLEGVYQKELLFRERGDYKRGCIKESCCLERGLIRGGCMGERAVDQGGGGGSIRKIC